MSRSRVVAALAVAIVLAGLVAWQQVRERRMAACLAAGHAWNGPLSRCEPGRTIIRRGIERS